MNLTVAGNMTASLAAYAGQAVALPLLQLTLQQQLRAHLLRRFWINGTLTIDRYPANSSYDYDQRNQKDWHHRHKFTVCASLVQLKMLLEINSFYQAGSVGKSCNVKIYIAYLRYDYQQTVSTPAASVLAVIAKGLAKTFGLQVISVLSAAVQSLISRRTLIFFRR